MFSRITILIIAPLIFLGGLGTGFLLDSGEGDAIKDVIPFSLSDIIPSGDVDFGTVEDVWNTIHTEYVDWEKVDDTALVHGAIRGMLEALEDPFTIFFDPEETKNFLSNVNGTFEGIGAEIEVYNEELLIVAPLKDTPADRAGLLPKDHIIEINGKSTEGFSVEEAVSDIRGKKGTSVSLLIGRDGLDPFTVTILRNTIRIPSIRWVEEDGIATISFFSFTQNSSKDFERVAKEIKEAEIRGVILDLRSNPGGFLDESVNIAGLLLPEGTLVLREILGAGGERKHYTDGTGIISDIPIVVVVNEGSASASEILAGALRDQRDVVIVGKQTFGKGSVQSFEELSGGASFKYTIARWFTPAGTSIQDEGITPDVEVEFDSESEKDTQLQRARKTLEEIID